MSSIRFGIKDHIATILIDSPARCNALDREDITDLRQALDTAVLRTSEVRAIVLSGSGSTFCSGLNLRRMVPTATGMTEPEGNLKRTHFQHLILRLAEIRIPTIAAVNGPAVGAGMSLAVACTLTIMSRDAYLEPSIARTGLIPDGGLTYNLPRRIGPAHAARVLLSGERLDAESAQKLGLAIRVVDPGAALDEALRLSQRIATLPTKTVQMTHKLLFDTFERTLTAQLQEERKAQDEAIASLDCKEGITAFFNKRDPVFNRAPT